MCPRLADALGIPPVIKCQQRSICDGTEGLCMLLQRLAYPCRLSDMIARFGRPVPVMSMITKEVMNFRGGSRGIFIIIIIIFNTYIALFL